MEEGTAEVQRLTAELSENAQLRARLAEVERERDEARRLHSEAEGQIACRNELRYRCTRAEAELERLRAVVEAARVVVHRGTMVIRAHEQDEAVSIALAALDAESEKKGGK